MSENDLRTDGGDSIDTKTSARAALFDVLDAADGGPVDRDELLTEALDRSRADAHTVENEYEFLRKRGEVYSYESDGRTEVKRT